jgi:tetratricopeptide (TPR) repeat protein
MKLPAMVLALAFITSARVSGQGEKAQDVLGAAWDHFNAGRHDEGLAVIDKALANREPDAKKQAAEMRGFDAKGHEWDHAAVNTAGTLLLIRGRILEKQGHSSAALETYQRVVDDYPFAQAWDPAGWFWHPGEDAKRRAIMCLLRSALKARQLDEKFFPEKEDALDLPAQRTATAWVAGELLANDNFDALDFMAETARAKRIKFSNGDWMLRSIYAGLDTPYPVAKTEDDWKSWRDRLARWRETAPGSVTAKVAEAGYMIKYAWKARGSGYADKVKPEAWAIFEERISEAAKLLLAAPRECPEWYQAMSTVALAQDWDSKDYDEMFEEGWKAFPGFSPLVESKTYYLLPRWHGDPGDWQRFAVEFAGKYGPEHYVTAVNYASRFEGEETFRDIDKELLRRGWEVRIKEHPGSLALLHGYARMLVKIGDPHAAEWLDKLGDTYHAETWSSYSRVEEVRGQAKSQ